MAIFSGIMLVVVAGFILVTRMYDAGITSRTTQQNARLIVDDFAKNAHFSGKPDTVASGINTATCLYTGSNTVVYDFYAPDGSNPQLHNLYRKLITAVTCPTPNVQPDSSWQQINDTTVSVLVFDPQYTAGTGNGHGTETLTVTVGAISNFGLGDLLYKGNACISGANGSQYCSVSSLKTTVYLNGSNY
jgi:hypothetical protein